MGIPSYFSQVIRKYARIMRNHDFFNNTAPITHLYMDCNSIVYDSYHSLAKTFKYTPEQHSEFEDTLIQMVATGIEKYIYMIHPTEVVYISFDGVAPIAKMKQQRSRRYMTQFMSKIKYDENQVNDPMWNTSSITPGTVFMDKLSAHIYYYFQLSEQKYNVNQVIVSCSDKPGEGEHKIYQHIRDNDLSGATVSVYGLDADLIMLSIFHLRHCDNIYVFREAPEFLKNSIPLDIQNHDNKPYFIDIQHLSECIIIEMDCCDRDPSRIDDYVFLCFFLGNDFLPHIPSLNIRTNGIDTLINAYRKCIGNVPNKRLITSATGTVHWENVRKLVKAMADIEPELMKTEHKLREKFDKFKFPETTRSDKENLLLNAPIIYRQKEKSINNAMNAMNGVGSGVGSGVCRYNALLSVDVSSYVCGLNWVLRYYTCGVCDAWWYSSHSGPLLCDVLKCLDALDVSLFRGERLSCMGYTQMAYVLPRESLNLLPPKIERFLLENYSELYPSTCEFEWSYSRYLWESKPLLPEIPLTLLKKWNYQFQLYKENEKDKMLRLDL